MLSRSRAVIDIPQQGRFFKGGSFKALYLLSPWVEAREKYTSQMPSEGQGLVCFSKWHKQADEFLVSSGIDAAHAYAGTVKDSLQQFLSACGTDGLQHDASTLLPLLWDALSRRVTELENIDGNFINAN